MLKIINFFLLLLTIISLNNCANFSQHKTSSGKPLAHALPPQKYQLATATKSFQDKGTASWYGKRFHKRRTSSGERYNMYDLTAAHKSLPFATRLQVTNLANGRSVIVKINDRGPFVRNRLLDLSYAAAKKLGMVNRGLATVKMKVLA